MQINSTQIGCQILKMKIIKESVEGFVLSEGLKFLLKAVGISNFIFKSISQIDYIKKIHSKDEIY